MGREPVLGGQALIEGVMMKSPNYISIAVRKPNKKISLKIEKFNSLTKKYRILGWPFIRGVIILFEMLITGMKALTYSANESGESEEEELTKKEIVLTIGFAMLFTALLFIALPFYLSKLITSNEGILFNLIDGVIRVVIFLIYIIGISLMPDIKRVFQYHGAEHMSIHCMEHKEKLTPTNVAKYTPEHPRCGTSFLIIVLLISIIVFSMIISELWYVKLLGRLVLLPLIAGISYEILKLSAKYRRNPIFKLIVWPGMMLQKITTREPDKGQIEVAIRALKGVAKEERMKI